MVYPQAAFLALVAAIVVFPLYGPVKQRIVVFGLTRSADSIVNIHGKGLRIIPDTVQCEDSHLHQESGMIFTACQGSEDPDARWTWFPPLIKFDEPGNAKQGSIYVVDPKTFSSQKLQLTGFSGPLVTHGMDILTDPTDAQLLHIFVINHLPNPQHWYAQGTTQSSNKTLSQIEVFSHVLGSQTAEHVRSINDPLIKTPNDILATSPTSFYVTNDHYYREGDMRVLEEVLTQKFGGWSDTLHVEITDPKSTNPSIGTHITVALTGLHNNNGLGRSASSRPEEILIIDASGGVLTRAYRSLVPAEDKKLTVVEHIQFDTTLDNPFYYDDPWATPEDDASGYVLAGLTRGISLALDFSRADKPIPSTVWYSRRSTATNGTEGESHKAWEKTVIFQDDGNDLRSASSAIMIGIDPKEEGGKKRAWLFVTGFASYAMVATKVDL